MSKRKPDTDLNSDNWNQEEVPEVAGKFKQVSKEALQGRTIRTVKRRLQAGASASSGARGSVDSKKLFAGFTNAMKTNYNSSSISDIAKNSFSFLKQSNTPLKSSSTEINNDTDKSEAHQIYLRKLKGLNEAVLDWIKQHVESNPCCILTPVFRDYDNYLKEIQNEKDKSSAPSKPILSTNSETTPITTSSSKESTLTTPETKSPSFTFSSKASEKEPSFNFGSKNASDKTSKPSFFFGSKEKPTSPPFLFGSSNSMANNATPSFGLPTSKDKESALSPSGDKSTSAEKKPFFNFGSVTSDKPALDVKFPSDAAGKFTFGNLNNPPESSVNNEKNNDNEDEEPQPEAVQPVLEDDAVYTQRVKVFVKKGETYADLGVGNLFIKSTEGCYQALVRNDTRLGNIIFNIRLSAQHPTKRLGTNNVMIVCQPTSQHIGPAVPVLLRVKTSEDADKLFETIEKYKT